MKTYYVRHGQTKANLEGYFAGAGDDTPMTDLGREQVAHAGRELKDKKIQRIVASPLGRTRESATLIAEIIGFNPANIEFDDRFVEYDIGAGQGMKVKETTPEQLISFEGAEDPYLFAARVLEGLKDVVRSGQTTLLVAHNGVGRMIESLRTQTNPEEFLQFDSYPNGHAVELDLSWVSGR